jgi:hypothetical protein
MWILPICTDSALLARGNQAGAEAVRDVLSPLLLEEQHEVSRQEGTAGAAVPDVAMEGEEVEVLRDEEGLPDGEVTSFPPVTFRW